MMTASIIGKVTNKKSAAFLLASAGYGLVASFALTIEKLHTLARDDYVPACSINPIISCSGAMDSAQAETFGIPNSLFGIAAYASVVAVSALLLMGARINKHIWTVMGLGALLAVAFVAYLIIQSIFVMHVVCPWCFGVWMTTPLLFASIMRLGADAWPKGQKNGLIHFFIWASRHWKWLLGAWYIVLFGTLGIVFWEFWVSLIAV